jgi:hypothetical protein
VVRAVRRDTRWAEIELGEILDQRLQTAVAISGVAEFGFAVEHDVGKGIANLSLIRFRDRVQRLIDQFADVVSAALPVDIVEICSLRKDKALAFHAPEETHLVVPVPPSRIFVMFVPDVADVLEEEEDQDKVLVFGRVDHTPEGVARGPSDPFYVVQCGLLSHGVLL